MKKPILYIFAISHYCEKARWALDASGLDYKLKHVAPGAHMQLAKKLGLKSSSVPILVADGQTVQGSSEIIDWIYDKAGVETANTGSEIEDRLDDVLGVHVRRYYYSEAMVDHPQIVKPMLTKNVPTAQKLLVNSLWSKIRSLMIKGLDLGPEQRTHSKSIVEKEMDWLDDILSDGRNYLIGDTFSRADITAASLLAPLVNPNEHPTYPNLKHPPILSSEVAEWHDRPVFKWTSKLYNEYR